MFDPGTMGPAGSIASERALSEGSLWLNPSHKFAGNLLPRGAWRVSAITLQGPGELLQPLRPGLLDFRNYEQIVKAHQDNPHEGEVQVGRSGAERVTCLSHF